MGVFMEKRRQFLKTSLKLFTGLGVLFSPFSSAVRYVYAKTGKVLLPKHTSRRSLIHKDPSQLDARNMEITPLKDFRTMGITDHTEDIDKWRLQVTGYVRDPLKLAYPQVLALPSVERKVLMICPGVFANHGLWKGISMKALFDMTGPIDGATHVSFSGPEGESEKVERYLISEVLSENVFLAYSVNGKPLPQKHGFPLRLVAEDYFGHEWVKHVYKVELEKA